MTNTMKSNGRRVVDFIMSLLLNAFGLPGIGKRDYIGMEA